MPLIWNENEDSKKSNQKEFTETDMLIQELKVAPTGQLIQVQVPASDQNNPKEIRKLLKFVKSN